MRNFLRRFGVPAAMLATATLGSLIPNMNVATAAPASSHSTVVQNAVRGSATTPTVQPKAAPTAQASPVPFPLCATDVSLQSWSNNKWLQVLPDGEMIANASKPSAATQMDFCVIQGRWTVYAHASNGAVRALPWRDSLVMADMPLNASSIEDQVILGCVNGYGLYIRFRTNGKYAEIAGGAEPFALGMNPNYYRNELFTPSAVKLDQLVGGACIQGLFRPASVQSSATAAPGAALPALQAARKEQ